MAAPPDNKKTSRGKSQSLPIQATTSVKPGSKAIKQAPEKTAISSLIADAVCDFFGVGATSPLDSDRWKKRRLTYSGRYGLLKEEYCECDTVDRGQDIPMQPLQEHVPSQRRDSETLSPTMPTLPRTGTRRRKPSVFSMTMKGVAIAAGLRPQGSATRVSASPDDLDIGSLPTLEREPRIRHPDIPETGAASVAQGPDVGWRRAPPPAYPSTPSADVGDGNLVTRVVGAAMEKPARRRIGVGFLGRVFRRTYRKNLSSNVKKQLDEFDDHRPFFTYWVTFVQLIVFIVSLAVHGFAQPGVSNQEISAQVMKPNLVIETSRHSEPQNLWLGNRQVK